MTERRLRIAIQQKGKTTFTSMVLADGTTIDIMILASLVIWLNMAE